MIDFDGKIGILLACRETDRRNFDLDLSLGRLSVSRSVSRRIIGKHAHSSIRPLYPSAQHRLVPFLLEALYACVWAICRAISGAQIIFFRQQNELFFFLKELFIRLFIELLKDHGASADANHRPNPHRRR